MAEYKVTIELDVGQDKALKERAREADTTVEAILDGQITEKVMGQINQWITDEVSAELKKLTPAEALAKLKYL